MHRGVTFEKVFSDIFFFLWLVILWGVIIYRLVSTGGSSDLLNYYTNWSWILQAVFFLIDYIGRIVEWARDAAGVYIRFYNALGLFWLISVRGDGAAKVPDPLPGHPHVLVDQRERDAAEVGLVDGLQQRPVGRVVPAADLVQEHLVVVAGLGAKNGCV